MSKEFKVACSGFRKIMHFINENMLNMWEDSECSEPNGLVISHKIQELLFPLGLGFYNLLVGITNLQKKTLND